MADDTTLPMLSLSGKVCFDVMVCFSLIRVSCATPILKYYLVEKESVGNIHNVPWTSLYCVDALLSNHAIMHIESAEP
jgi:orotate phosphoribosyltransferase-like protein